MRRLCSLLVTLAVFFSTTVPMLAGDSPRTHPRLFFSTDEMSELREASRKPPLAAYRRNLLEAAGNLEQQPIQKVKDPDKSSETLKVLTWAYVLTGKQSFADQLKKWMLRVAETEKVLDFRLMIVGMMAFSYDVMAPEMGDAERKKVKDYLTRALDIYLREARKKRWFFTNDSNTNPVANAGGGLAALVLLEDHPEAREAIQFARHWCRKYADTVLGPDGGNVEGRLYWAYGLSHYLLFAEALHNVTGNTTLKEHPHLKRNPKFVKTMIGGAQEQFMMFNDDHPDVADSGVCAFLGARFDRPLMTKLADRYPNRTRMSGFDLLWRSRSIGDLHDREAPVKLPTLSVLNDIQWGVLRSDGSLNPDLVVGLKGSEGPTSHHTQRDPGSFVLHGRNERILIDPGYGFERHNVVKLHGKGPHRSGAMVTDVREAGSIRAAVIDSTKAYGPRASRVRRLLAMVGEEWLVVFDDVVPPADDKRKGELTFQTGRADHRDDDQLTPHHVRVLGPRRAMIRQDRSFTGMNVFGAAGPLSVQALEGTHLFSTRNQLTAPMDTEPRPVITVFQVAGTPSALQRPDVSINKKTARVNLPDGPTLTYHRTKVGWGLKLDGTVMASPAKHPYRERSITSPKTDQPPEIDGNLNDPVWKRASVADAFVSDGSWGNTDPSDLTSARLAWDEENLYVGIESKKPTERDDVHILLGPEPGSETIYRLIFKANGKQEKKGWGATDAYTADIVSATGTEKNRRILELKLSWAGFRIDKPQTGRRLKLNFSRERTTDATKRGYQWSHTRGYMKDSPVLYGDLILGEE